MKKIAIIKAAKEKYTATIKDMLKGTRGKVSKNKTVRLLCLYCSSHHYLGSVFGVLSLTVIATGS